MSRLTIKVEIDLSDDESGLYGEVEIPARYEVCPRCEGRGAHDHPAFSNGITSEEWNGPDWDDESRESYLSGRYDVSCEECHGERVVAEPDESACNTPELKAQLEAYRRHLSEKDEMCAIEAAERRMGA